MVVGRRPSAEELDEVSEQVKGGKHLSEIVNSIASSEEATAFARSKSAIHSRGVLSAVMEIIYRNFLGRSISETEVDHFFSGYKSGENFFDVILTIENSEEAQAARQNRQAGPLATRTKSDYVIDSIIQWRASGYVLGPVIRETPRYISYRLERAGQSFFAKLSVSNEAHMMENEVWWALTMSRLTGDNQDVPVRAARILEHGQNWYISEWIEAPLLLEDAWSHGDTLVEPVVDRLVSTLLWLDRLCQSTTANALYYLGSSVPRLHDIETMMEELFATNYISADKLARAIQLVQPTTRTSHPPSSMAILCRGTFLPLPNSRFACLTASTPASQHRGFTIWPISTAASTPEAPHPKAPGRSCAASLPKEVTKRPNLRGHSYRSSPYGAS